MYTMNYIITLKPYTCTVHLVKCCCPRLYMHIKNDSALPKNFAKEINNHHAIYFIGANINYCLTLAVIHLYHHGILSCLTICQQ